MRFYTTLIIYLLFFYSIVTLAAQKKPESRTDFMSLKVESFEVIHLGKGGKVWSKTVSLKLVEITELQKLGNIERFSLLLQGPKQPELGKKVYDFDNVKTGRFSLFLEPAKGNNKNRRYEAVFNLLMRK